MLDDAWQRIAKAIARGDGLALVEALERLDEADRKRLSSRAKSAAKAAKEYTHEDRWAWRPDADERRISARTADAAVFGTGGSAAATRIWWLPSDRDLCERLIRARPREWRQDWAERVMSEREACEWDWRIVHRMVKEGLIDRPAADGYVVAAVGGMYEWTEDRGDSRPGRKPLAETLRHEEEWLQTDLWRFFEVEEAGLSGRDSWEPTHAGEQTWQEALCELAAEGTIPRARLLDESLAALRRDFSPHNSRWFHKLYDALSPTDAEQLQRLDELLALLAASDPAVAGFALRALDKLERKKLLPADRLFEAIPPALHLPVKTHATRAVKLVGRVLKRDADYASIALPPLVDALAHEARDVQELVLDVLERHRDALTEADRVRLTAISAGVDPAVRERVDALGADDVGSAQTWDQPASQITAGPLVELPPRRSLDPNIARLASTPLAPPTDVDELLDRLPVALEREDDPDEIELMLDGISRLRDRPVNEGRARAVLERTLVLSPAWQDQMAFGHARDGLAAVVVRWLGGPKHRKTQLGPTGRSPREALALRIRELADDMPKGKPRELLSAPTHPGGWIDPHVAIRRVRGLGGGKPPVMDLSQMVLRLAPDGRESARDQAARERGEAAAILSHALGGNAKRPLLSKLKPAWRAAEQAREPDAFELPRRPLLDHDALRARWLGGEKAKVDPASPADLLVLEESWWGWEPGGIERWLTRVWPSNREGLFDMVARRLWVNRGTREYGIEDVLGVLLDPGEPIRDQATLATALALGSAEITHRALAADISISGFTTRRLDGEALGTKFVLMLRRQEDPVPARWAASLADVAAAGPLGAHEVQSTIEKILAAANDQDRRRLLGLVDLLRRLAVEADAAITNARAREWLSSLGAGSKVGRAGKEALAVAGSGAARSRAVAAEALV